MSTILLHVVLLTVVLTPSILASNNTQCEAGCGTQDDLDYIDYCYGEDDVISNMVGTNSIYCQKLEISGGNCDMVGSYNSSLSQPLPFTDVSDGRMYIISFRNSNLSKCYNDHELCSADVECDAGQTAYYNIIDHDIESESGEAQSFPDKSVWCGDLLNDNQCLDYLHVTRTVYNDDYCTCGRVGVGGQTFTSLGIPDDGAEFERVSMTHRSNSDCRGFGTLATVTCLNNTASARKKRATSCRNTFVVPKLRATHPPVPLLPTVRVDRRLYPHQFVRIVNLGEGFTYSNKQIKDCKNGVVWANGVSFLARVNVRLRKHLVRSYKGTAPGAFHGYGRLLLVINSVHRIKRAIYIGDELPPGLQMSRDDKLAVNAMQSVIARRLMPSSSNSMTGQIISQPLPESEQRNGQSSDLKLSTSDYEMMSRMNMDACQPLVRIAANVYSRVFHLSMEETDPITAATPPPRTIKPPTFETARPRTTPLPTIGTVRSPTLGTARPPTVGPVTKATLATPPRSKLYS